MKMLKLTQLALKEKFFMAVIYGEKEVGKSVYAMKVAKQILGDWEKVLDSIVFRLEDLIEALREGVYGKRLELLIWDDAGVHGSKYTWFTDRELYERLSNFWDTIREAVRVLLITTPTPRKLARFLRDEEYYVVRVRPHGSIEGVPRSKAIIYKQVVLPSGLTFPRKTGMVDTFRVRVPDDVYRRYHAMRKHYTVETFEALEATVHSAIEEYGVIESERQ